MSSVTFKEHLFFARTPALAAFVNLKNSILYVIYIFCVVYKIKCFKRFNFLNMFNYQSISGLSIALVALTQFYAT